MTGFAVLLDQVSVCHFSEQHERLRDASTKTNGDRCLIGAHDDFDLEGVSESACSEVE